MVFKQRPPLLVTVGTAVLLVFGGAIAYFGFSKRLATVAKIPASMELVPKDALLSLTLTTDENQWTRLRQLGTPESQQSLDQLLVTWRDRVITANGYRFKSDIHPWIGEQITLVWLPQTGADSGQMEQLLLVPIVDLAQAQALLSEPQDGVSWVGRNYKNIDVQSIKTLSGETFESAVLEGKWLVLASGTTGVEAVIDSFSDGSSVFNDDTYRQATKGLRDGSAAHVYVNVPRISTWLAGSDLPGVNGLVATVNSLPNGLAISAATWLGPEDQPIYSDMVNATAALVPAYVPESAALLVSTGNIGPLWQALKEADRLRALLPVSLETVENAVKTQTGLTIDNDILPWLAGEVAFGLLPPPEGEEEPADAMGQIILLAEVGERAAAEETWAQLDEVMASRYRFQVDVSESETQTMTRWTSAFGGISMGHGWLRDNVTFLGVGSTAVDAIAPKPSKKIQAHPAFQTLMDISPRENSGYLFMDFSRLNKSKNVFPFPTLPDHLLFSTVKSIGVTTQIEDERSLIYDIFVELPKGQRVKPLPKVKTDKLDPEESNETDKPINAE